MTKVLEFNEADDEGPPPAELAEAATTRQAGPLAPAVLAATVAWLRGRSDAAATQRAYTSDLAAWLDFCIDQRLDPLLARAADLVRWADQLATAPRPATGRALAPASRARTLAAVSSWYDYLLDTGLVAGNPVTVARPVLVRNPTGRNGSTPSPARGSARSAGSPGPGSAGSPGPGSAGSGGSGGLAPEAAAALFAASASDTGPAAARNRVVVRLLAQVGMPVREVVAADVAGYVREARSGPGRLRLVSRTGSSSTRELPAEVADLLDAYLAERATRTLATGERTSGGPLTGPLLATATGRRLDQPAVFRLVRRLARLAELPDAERLSPAALAAAARPGDRAAARTARDGAGLPRTAEFTHRDPVAGGGTQSHADATDRGA